MEVLSVDGCTDSAGAAIDVIPCAGSRQFSIARSMGVDVGRGVAATQRFRLVVQVIRQGRTGARAPRPGAPPGAAASGAGRRPAPRDECA
jgi:hypothetical protein